MPQSVTMAVKEWQLGTPETATYCFYDGLRNRLNNRLVSYLLEKAVPNGDAVVVEAGSGPGFASSILNNSGRTRISIALDIDLEALEEARKRDSALPLVVADLRALPFRSESVDLAWNSSTLEHLPEMTSALREMTRVVKPGGRVFVGVPNLFGPLGFERLIRNTAAGVWIGKTFSLAGLSNVLRSVGLSPERHIFYFFRFFVGSVARRD